MNVIDISNSKKFNKYIERIWIAEIGAEGFKTIIPPTQYIDIVFPLSQEGCIYNESVLHNPFLEELMDKPVYFELLPGSKIVGFRFYCFGLFPFLEYQAKDVVNNILELIPLQKDFGNFYKAIEKVNSKEEIFTKAEVLLETLFNKERAEKITLVEDFYGYLVKNIEKSSVKDFCDSKHIEYITLNRHFSKYVGITPKKFSRLIKFRKALDNMLQSNSNLTHVGSDSKYFDQSHFIREFKYYMGMSPKQYASLLKNEYAGIFNYAVDFSSF